MGVRWCSTKDDLIRARCGSCHEEAACALTEGISVATSETVVTMLKEVASSIDDITTCEAHVGHSTPMWKIEQLFSCAIMQECFERMQLVEQILDEEYTWLHNALWVHALKEPYPITLPPNILAQRNEHTADLISNIAGMSALDGHNHTLGCSRPRWTTKVLLSTPLASAPHFRPHHASLRAIGRSSGVILELC